MPGFELIKGGEQPQEKKSFESLRKQLRELAEEYSTHIGLHPQWCVYGDGPEMGAGVLYWIKPLENAEFAARKMAQIINKMGGHARAEMTEWNEDLQGKSVYEQKGHLNYITTQGREQEHNQE